MTPEQSNRVNYRATPLKIDTPPTSQADRKNLIDGLNDDLAGEYQAVMMYTHYSAKLTGPHRLELRSMFQAEITDELGHAQFLSDKIAALGGEPTTTALPVSHVETPREMLEAALAAEIRAIAGYTQRLGQAEQCSDFGLKVVLENQVADETRHKESIERILAGWTEPQTERSRADDRWQDDGGPIAETLTGRSNAGDA
jgi:bacterioferritin